MSQDSTRKRPAASASLDKYFSRAGAPAAAAAASNGSRQSSPVKKPRLTAISAPAPAAAAAAASSDDADADPFGFDDDDEVASTPRVKAQAAPILSPNRAATASARSAKTTSDSSRRSAAAASRGHVVELSDDDDDDAVDLTAGHAAKPASSSAAAAAAGAAAAAASPVRPATAAAAAAASPSKGAAAEASRAREEKKKREAAAIASALARAEAERVKQRQRDEAAAAAISAAAPAAAAASSGRGGAAASKRKKSTKWDGSELAKKVSEDVDVVLAPVMRLSAAMAARESEMQRRGEKQLVLADLALPGVKTEVQSLSDDEVRAQIERATVSCISSIMSGSGFRYDVPVRSSANQLYVAVLDRIVLKDKVAAREFASLRHGRKTALTTRVLGLVYELCTKHIHVTKRDLFYTDVKLFSKQADSDDVIEDVAAMIGSTRTSLNVVASEKGVVVGQISFRDDGDFIDCTKMGVGGKAIPPSIDRITEIAGAAKFILLVEKDAAFMRLAEDRFYNKYPCIIITAKGQPDVATRLFLKKVKTTLKIPVLGLVDSDPYGLKILSVYMSGSKNMSYDSASLTTPDIKWLGVRPSDLDRYHIPAQCRLPMSDHDLKTGRELMEEEFIQKNPAWMKELEIMVRTKEKAEIQSLSSFGFQYLSQVFLPLKIQQADWI